MSRVRPCLRLALALAFALASARGSMASLAETDASDPRAQDHVDAAALYDAGTEALARGDLGPAVTFLLAAYRIDPRARDIRTNLGIARARVEAAEGSGDHGMPPAPPPFALSPAESWHLAAALALAGALVAWMAAARPRARRLLLAGSALFAACSTDRYLGVNAPSRVPVEVFDSPTNAALMVNSAVGDFECAFEIGRAHV